MSQHLFLWMGAVIVPDDVNGLYSTCILLLCLYLISQRVRIEGEVHLVFVFFAYFLLMFVGQYLNQMHSIMALLYDNLIVASQKFGLAKGAVDNMFVKFSSWRFSRALLFGEKDAMNQLDKWVVQVLGVGHLFVVSGLHVGYLYAIIRIILNVIWCVLPASLILIGLSKRALEVFFTIVLIMLYGSFVGWGPAVSRACIMLICLNVLKAYHRSLSVKQLLLIAFMLVIAINSENLYSAGFWLSFVLVFVIVHMIRVPMIWPLKLFCIQILLSLTSMIIVVGWQEHVSIYTMFVNMVVIPFTAFFWFPVGVFSVIETLLLDTYYLMFFLDVALAFLFDVLSFIALQMTLVEINPFLPLPLIVFSIFVVVIMVMYFRWLSFIATVLMGVVLLFVGNEVTQSALFSCWLPGKFCPSKVFIIENKNNELLFSIFQKSITTDGNHFIRSVFLDTGWYSGGSELKNYLQRIELLDKKWTLLIWPDSNSKLTVKRVFDMLPDLIILSTMPDENLIKMLDALKVAWIQVGANEKFVLKERSDSIYVGFSACHFLLLSHNQGLCERIEKIDIMVN
ncbi:ComEC/Rec2 family competence protein [Marinomonas algicola]|uniref:ComEC/Rec2 family competence protein n=1 Tax=Marinomonas algicola TaxID=2773454 RepID=UPI00174C031C|nr:ComEC/Rec2 family competence protein [Marinomonas algicola]